MSEFRVPRRFRDRARTFGLWRLEAEVIAATFQIVQMLLPDGRRSGDEWVARNPLRADRSPGSFQINIRTGRWSDFATEDRGGDILSLASYLLGCSRREALYWLAYHFHMVG